MASLLNRETKRRLLMEHLVQSMCQRIPTRLVDSRGSARCGIVNEIQAEDGSGFCFNVTLHTGACVFIRVL